MEGIESKVVEEIDGSTGSRIRPDTRKDSTGHSQLSSHREPSVQSRSSTHRAPAADSQSNFNREPTVDSQSSTNREPTVDSQLVSHRNTSTVPLKPGQDTIRPSAFSPTRVNTFRKCPLQFRFQNVDKLPTKNTQAQVRGTLVHAVLEDLFDLPRQERNLDNALASLRPHWNKMLEDDPGLYSELFTTDQVREEEKFLGEATTALHHYFGLENPEFLEPSARELFLQVNLDNGLNLRGIIDRVDKTPGGLIRIVDYKTGKAPKPQYLEPYLLQLRFYALMWYQSYGVLPTRLQLLFLKDQQSYSYSPVAADLDSTAGELWQVWRQLERCIDQQSFQPRSSPLCAWCDFQAYCPVFGGRPPEIPLDNLEYLRSIKSTPQA